MVAQGSGCHTWSHGISSASESLERGEMKHGSADSDVELDSQSEIEESSDLEEHEFEDTMVDAMLVEEEDEEEDGDDDEQIINDFDAEDERHANGNQANNLPINHPLLGQKSNDFDIEVSLKNDIRERSIL